MKSTILRWIRQVVPTSLALLCVMSVALPAHAQDQDFKAGMEARDGKKWEQVVNYMRRAIQANPQEFDRKVEWGGVLGMRKKSVDYLPYYYLGEALQKQQDCLGAVDAWATSEKRGIVQSHSDLMATIRAGYTTCEMKGVLSPSRLDPLLARTTAQLTTVRTLAGTVSQLGTANPDQWRQEMREQYDKAAAELNSALKHLSDGTRLRSGPEFANATAAGERARVLLVGIESNLNAAVDTQRALQNLAREVEQVLGAADALDRSIDTKRAALSQSLSAMRQQGRDAVTRARDRYASGMKAANTSTLLDARSFGQDASSKFKYVLDEIAKLEKGTVDRQLSDALGNATQNLRLLDELFGTLDKRLSAHPALGPQMAPERDAIRKQADIARRRLEAATAANNVSGIAQAAQLTSEARDRLNLVISKFGPITLRERGINEALEEGARQYLAGHFQQALAALNPAQGFAPDSPLRLHVHLFRAAAAHELFVRSHEKDAALRKQALSEIDECKKMDSSFQPDPRAFSPGFIALFQSVGANGSRSSAATTGGQ